MIAKRGRAAQVSPLHACKISDASVELLCEAFSLQETAARSDIFNAVSDVPYDDQSRIEPRPLPSTYCSLLVSPRSYQARTSHGDYAT